jgi:hypothetical protein
VYYSLDRFEMKFVITRDQRETLMPCMLPYLRADENAGEGAYYPIISLYYDTPERDCYWEKIRGFNSRRKLRVRVYGSMDGTLPPTCFVEVKHKCDGRGVKRRLRVSLEDALAVADGKPIDQPLSFSDQRIVDEVHQMVNKSGFRPSCCMRYDRQAFAARDPECDLRITFDTGIAYRSDNLVPVPDDRRFEHYLLPEGFSVMEVKVTGAVPYWLTRLVGEHQCILQSHSKYCNALEDGDPVLHRMLGGRPNTTHYHVVQPTPSFATFVDTTPEPAGSSRVVAV